MPRLFSDDTQMMNNNDMISPAQQDTTFTSPPMPDFNTPAMQGSLQQALAQNLGEYVEVEFLIGTNQTMVKQGLLYDVGTSVVTLFEQRSGTYVVCDIFSVKFVTFFPYGASPWQMGGRGTYPTLVQPVNQAIRAMGQR